jgi:lysine 6-dehydrogenase
VRVGEVYVRPIDFTASLLFPQWRLEPGEREFTAMEVLVCGCEDGERREYRYSLFDQTDVEGGVSSMARTTGYTCTAVARLVLEGRYRQAGICPPEYVGADDECFEAVLAGLAARGVNYRRSVRVLDSHCP